MKSPRAQPTSSSLPEGLILRMRFNLQRAFNKASRCSSSRRRCRNARFASETFAATTSGDSVPRVRLRVLLPTYRKPQLMHSTKGPSRRLEFRRNRGLPAPQMSHGTKGLIPVGVHAVVVRQVGTVFDVTDPVLMCPIPVDCRREPIGKIDFRLPVPFAADLRT